MVETADEVIDVLRKRFRVSTDQALAEQLHLGRSTVTSWRRRGSVPDRYVRMASERPTILPDLVNPQFDDTERSALTLALVRFIRDNASVTQDYQAFLSKGGFLPAKLAIAMEKALLDVSARMEEGELEDAWRALNLIVFEELFQAK